MFTKFYVKSQPVKNLLLSTFNLAKNNSSKFLSIKKPIDDVRCPAKPRFIQFVRKIDGRQRVGITSYTGDCLVDLTGQCATAKTMKQFLENNCSVEDVQFRVKNLRGEWTNDNIRLLPPIINPGKIMCFDYRVNTFNDCSVFITNKLPICITGPTDNIELEENVDSVQITVDLAVIIGKTTAKLRKHNIMDCVFGYSIANNVTAIAAKGSNSVVKNSNLIRTSMKTFCPLGPLIVHKSILKYPQDLWASITVNGGQVFRGNTNHLEYQIGVILEAILKYTSLNAGDIVLIKIPSDETQDPNILPCVLKRGDVIESEIQDIGKLKNRIISADPSDDDDDGCHVVFS